MFTLLRTQKTIARQEEKVNKFQKNIKIIGVGIYKT